MDKKKRRIRLRRGLTFALAILLTVVIAVVVFQRSGILSYQLSKYVNDHYFRDTPFSFSCGKISGDLVGHVSLAKPVIRYEGEDRSLKVFAADRIDVDYDLLEVLKLRMMVSYLGIEGARISVWNDEEGKPILPIPAEYGEGEEQAITPHVEVERFSIQDLQFAVETAETTYTVENLDLSGSLRFVEGTGEVEVNHGTARVVETGTQVQSLQAEVEFGPGTIAVSNLVFRLDESFVMLSGRYENERFQHVQGVFNPLNLDELSSLGLINESGEVGGSVVVEGVPDSLDIRGSLTGRGLGLVFSGLSFEGIVTPQRVHFSTIRGQVFGTRLAGDLVYARDTGGYTFEGECEGLDISHGFLPDRGIPTTDLNGSVYLDHDGVTKSYEIRTDLTRSTISDFESEAIRFNANWNRQTGLSVRSLTLSRPGFVLDGFGTLDKKDNVDLILNLKGSDLDYLMTYLSLPLVGGSVDLAGKLVGPIDRLQLNLNGSWHDLDYVGARIDTGTVHAEARNIRSEDVSARVDVEGRHLDILGRAFSDPHIRFEAAPGAIAVRDFSFSLGDTFITTDFEVEPGELETTIHLKHLAIDMPQSTWKNREPSTVKLTDASTFIDTLILESNGHEVGVVGSYSTDQRWCDLYTWGNNLDLALLATTVGAPIRVEGVGAYQARFSENLDNPKIELFIDLANGVIDSLLFDRLVLDGRFSGDGYAIDHLCINHEGDSLTVNGTWSHDQSPIVMLKSGINKDDAMSARLAATVTGY
ncbi:MAG: hypothetical protein JSW58_10555, partial [Candidatus Latescibacterota bacterium]